ncbi:MAG: hypothetical protein EOP05_05900 [Proteobacteria bacterium]|nr:MAG: hypothetical protein EOP05_05900 [Pseudomonadota bacterium]
MRKPAAFRDVTPSSQAASTTAVVPVGFKSTALIVNGETNRQAMLAPRPKMKRVYKKSKIQSFVELMLAAGSLLFLAMT